MIAHFIAALQSLGLEPTAAEIADILWLASHLDAPVRTTDETSTGRTTDGAQVSEGTAAQHPAAVPGNTSDPESAKRVGLPFFLASTHAFC